MGTKFHGLITMGMFVDTWIHGFIWNIIEVSKYFIVILNSYCPIHEIHEMFMNKNDFTISVAFLQIGSPVVKSLLCL